jgi:hypothetical protein
LNIANEVGREMLTKNFAVQVVRGKTDDELIKDLNKSDEAGEIEAIKKQQEASATRGAKKNKLIQFFENFKNK